MLVSLVGLQSGSHLHITAGSVADHMYLSDWKTTPVTLKTCISTCVDQLSYKNIRSRCRMLHPCPVLSCYALMHASYAQALQQQQCQTARACLLHVTFGSGKNVK